MELSTLINIVYLLSAVTFILGFKLMSHPETAKNGNLISGVGMAAAIIVTLMDLHIERYDYILTGIVVGAAIGLRLARKTPDQKMPQVVGLLNGFGGLASLLVAWAEFHAHPEGQGFLGGFVLWLTAIFGALTFSGSLLVWARLEEKFVSGKSVVYNGQQLVSAAIFLAVLLAGLMFSIDTVAQDAYRYFAIFSVLALVLGVVYTLPMGNADMPVVICLLNSYSGVAACASGFIIQNNLLIAAGALVGASGIALCMEMSKTLGRPFSYFFLGAFVARPTGISMDLNRQKDATDA